MSIENKNSLFLIRKDLIEKTFNKFNGKNFNELDKFYTRDVVFQDPILRLEGLVNLKNYYSHAYENVKEIHFDFNQFFDSNETVIATWKMKLKVNGLNFGQFYEVEGLSILKFNKNNQVEFHRDSLDLGQMVYERIPILGALIKKIRIKLSQYDH